MNTCVVPNTHFEGSFEECNAYIAGLFANDVIISDTGTIPGLHNDRYIHSDRITAEMVYRWVTMDYRVDVWFAETEIN